jgi:hypothetical protein
MDFDEQKICAYALCRPHELNRRDGQLEPDAAADRWHRLPKVLRRASGVRTDIRHSPAPKFQSSTPSAFFLVGTKAS